MQNNLFFYNKQRNKIIAIIITHGLWSNSNSSLISTSKSHTFCLSSLIVSSFIINSNADDREGRASCTGGLHGSTAVVPVVGRGPADVDAEVATEPAVTCDGFCAVVVAIKDSFLGAEVDLDWSCLFAKVAVIDSLLGVEVAVEDSFFGVEGVLEFSFLGEGLAVFLPIL